MKKPNKWEDPEWRAYWGVEGEYQGDENAQYEEDDASDKENDIEARIAFGETFDAAMQHDM